ncbi:MAG: hypothetical protein AB1327_10360 [Bacillota bacterium]
MGTCKAACNGCNESRSKSRGCQGVPLCIDGARHRPPEDVGGVTGYKEFLSIIRDPQHPEHDDYLVWAEKDTNGRKFDPDYFYLNEINRVLAKIK